ncbi:hypothetical protein LB543_05170 [Mesorhizobium sp. ESP7-2]|uniref:hypothetical protein n=1 Tax=Mesorhizobium sp. ESP7-2 TaxID=2876622 RepID=UPI001CC9EAA8|nr:hypothetical protein [Mesorhizobium sp. ESP7-2]MBZ9706110.1 hypothetical protein [Mesorhizobium sp. ESP7-2]
MSSFGNSPTGANGPASYGSEVSKATFLGRLENALSRLDRAADGTANNAMTLTGGWPSQPVQSNGKDAPANAGVFGAVDDIAATIHRICDRIEDANAAVRDRLP